MKSAAVLPLEAADRGARVDATAGDPVVRVEGVSKRFRVRQSWARTLRHPLDRRWHEVLRSVTLHVRRGEFFGLLGPNGAGKTTLFKVLSTLISPDAGRIEVGGHDIRTAPEAVRGILAPVIADERSLNWRLSASENLRLFAALYGLRSPSAEIDRLLGVVGLHGAGDRMVGQYSSGMKQRLLIARALLASPEVLLLDEPTRSLDPVAARDFRRFLREDVVGLHGCTVLLATHNADEAFELCDRLAVLDRGRLVATGTAAALARQAGQTRYRLAVPAAEAERAIEVLRGAGHPSFARRGESEPGWVELVGDLPRGADQAADVASLLLERGVRIGEIGRLPLPLADMIERILAAGAER